MVWIEKNDFMRENYYMIFAKKKIQLQSNRELIVNTLGSGRNGLVTLLSKEKKLQICERLNNKCFLIG